jgi:hypothetical protein
MSVPLCQRCMHHATRGPPIPVIYDFSLLLSYELIILHTCIYEIMQSDGSKTMVYWSLLVLLQPNTGILGFLPPFYAVLTPCIHQSGVPSPACMGVLVFNILCMSLSMHCCMENGGMTSKNHETKFPSQFGWRGV